MLCCGVMKAIIYLFSIGYFYYNVKELLLQIRHSGGMRSGGSTLHLIWFQLRHRRPFVVVMDNARPFRAGIDSGAICR